MKKKVLVLSILCLLFLTVSYTYSAFRNTIEGNISATSSKWNFKMSISSGTKEDGYYKVPITSKSGSFYIDLDSTGSLYVTSYSIELEPVNLPDDIVSKLSYEGIIDKTTKSIYVSYKTTDTPNGYIKVYAKGKVAEYATIKNGYSSSSDLNGGTEFWNSDYKSYIKTITFANDLSEMPSSCTEENLCFDVTEEGSQEKVYGYLVDSGAVDSNSNVLYDLNIVSALPIFLPSDCSHLFSDFTSLDSFEFHDNFYMSNVNDMSYMFAQSSLINLILDGFNASNVTNMEFMFYDCKSLNFAVIARLSLWSRKSVSHMFHGCSLLEQAIFYQASDEKCNVRNITDMSYMFYGCSSLENTQLAKFDTSEVTDMSYMFYGCKKLNMIPNIKKVDFSNFDTSKVTNMSYMFYNCSSFIDLDLSYFDTSNVTNMTNMIYGCTSLEKLDLSNLHIIGYLWDIINSNCTSLTHLILRNADFSEAAQHPNTHIFSPYSNLKYLDFSDIKNYNSHFLGFNSMYNLEILNLSNFRFYNQENAYTYGMFSSCSKLTTLILTGFDTSNVINMSNMFSGCASLTSLDLTSFNTSNVINMYGMFNGCLSLSTLDLRSFDTTNVTDMSYMFSGCSSLTTSITIANPELTNFNSIFDSAAINSGAQITINYLDGVSELVDNMIATKADNSNVIKGNVATLPIIVETSHYPYYTDDYETFDLFEKTFEGASSITIIYDAESVHYSYGYMKINHSSSYIDPIANSWPTGDISSYYLDSYHKQMGISRYYLIGSYTANNRDDYSSPVMFYRMPVSAQVSGNYIKISFRSDSLSNNNYYGLRVIIIPHYENNNS